MPSVIVTGGARRIGKGVALRFAQRGWNVGITCHTSVAAAQDVCHTIRGMGRVCEVVPCDLRSAQATDHALRELAHAVGVPDAVVSNAGMFPRPMGTADLAPEILADVMSVNTIPLLTLARTYLDILPAGTGGRLVSVGSLGALELWKKRIAYNVSKSALHTLANALARDLAPRISVNTVAPGAVIFPDDPTEGDASVSGVERIPMGRYSTVDDVFDAVWFFATATPYITGQYLAVDGGYHLVR